MLSLVAVSCVNTLIDRILKGFFYIFLLIWLNIENVLNKISIFDWVCNIIDEKTRKIFRKKSWRFYAHNKWNTILSSNLQSKLTSKAWYILQIVFDISKRRMRERRQTLLREMTSKLKILPLDNWKWIFSFELIIGIYHFYIS